MSTFVIELLVVGVVFIGGIAYSYLRGSEEEEEESESNLEVHSKSGSEKVYETETEDENEVEEEPTMVGEEEQVDKEAEQEAELDAVKLIGPARAEELREEGFESVEDMREASREELVEVDGIGERNVDEIMEDL